MSLSRSRVVEPLATFFRSPSLQVTGSQLCARQATKATRQTRAAAIQSGDIKLSSPQLFVDS